MYGEGREIVGGNCGGKRCGVVIAIPDVC